MEGTFEQQTEALSERHEQLTHMNQVRRRALEARLAQDMEVVRLKRALERNVAPEMAAAREGIIVFKVHKRNGRCEVLL